MVMEGRCLLSRYLQHHSYLILHQRCHTPWLPLDDGICLEEIFKDIGTRLAAVLEAGLMVRYVYIQVSTCVARQYFH